MTDYYQKRIDSLKAAINSVDEALLITNEVNIGYFTGFFHSEGALLVTQDKTWLLVDFRYHEAAQKKSHACEVICFQRLSDELIKLMKEVQIASLRIEIAYLSVERYLFFKKKFAEEGIEVLTDNALDEKIASLRIIKDETEIEKLRKAQQIAEKAYLELLNDVKPGITERMLAAKMEFLMKTYGAEDKSFDLITITGKKTSLPHGVPSDDVVREGDFVTFDFGAIYEGYHSDTTRTVAVGHADDDMQKIYQIVLEAQLKALTVVKAGVAASEVDKTARDIITSAGYGKYFGHSTGHGVGLDIHENPAVSTRSEAILQAGMIITDEPGIYLPNQFGVRIEDMLCVTESGYENFVTLPKELIIL